MSLCNSKDVSIGCVIPTAGNRSSLYALLASVKRAANMARKKVAIVVVVDATLREYERVLCNPALPDGVLLVSHPIPLGPAAARNTGVKRLGNVDWICFFDDDVVVEPNIFQNLLSFLQSTENIDAVEGRVIACGNGLWDEEVQNNAKGRFLAANMMVRRKIFGQLGGFCEMFKGPFAEDQEFGSRLEEHARIGYDPKCVVYHLPRKMHLVNYMYSVVKRIELYRSSERLFYKINPEGYNKRRFHSTAEQTLRHQKYFHVVSSLKRRSLSQLISNPWMTVSMSLLLLLEQLQFWRKQDG